MKRKTLTEGTLAALGYPVSLEFSSGNSLLLDRRQAYRFAIQELFDGLLTLIVEGESRNGKTKPVRRRVVQGRTRQAKKGKQ